MLCGTGTVASKQRTWPALLRVLALAPVCLAPLLGGCIRHKATAEIPARPDLSGFPAGLTVAIARAETDIAQPGAYAAWLKLGRLYQANGYWAEARQCFQGLVDRGHESARACYGLAVVAQSAGDLAGEVRWLRETIARDGEYLPARLRLARACYKSGDTATAIACFHDVLQRDPGNAEALVGVARERIQTGDDAGALAILEDLTIRHPKFSTGFALLAQVMERQGEIEQAALFRAQARARKDPPLLDPWWDEVMESCYDVQQLARRFEDYAKSSLESQALATLHRLAALDPNHPLVCQMRAVAAVQEGRDADAVRAYERALASGGEAAKLYPAMVAALLRLERHDVAEQQARAGLALVPRSPELLLVLAEVRLKQGAVNEATQLLEAAVALAPEDVAVLHRLARLHGEAGRWAQATTHLETIRRVSPSDAPARAMLGEYLLQERRPRDALPVLREAHGLTPGDPRVQELFALAQVRTGNELAREGEFDAALAAYDQAIAIRPAMIEAHANKVQVFMRLRRPEQAKAALQLWLASQPEEPAAWVMLGDAQHAAGHADESIASWSRAWELLATRPDPQVQEALVARLGREVTR